ncbi:MAG: glycosyltransferase family 2 protein [Coriobacteriia bacterium]|nr:glycosyltransferase family 2 protein [Coriobacteriia bacterium]
MTSARAVTVVIPNWNGMKHLPECFETLDQQEFRDFVTVVVDNGSSDGSVGWLEANRSESTVVSMPENRGFSSAVNTGIDLAQTPYVALLNNDTALDPSWLGELVRALEEHPDYDIAASRMVYYDEPGIINAAGDTYDMWTGRGLNRGMGSPADSYREPVRVLGACAGAALYRTTIFDHVGRFAEEFFLLSEDTDFNLRALIAGHCALYVPSAIVRHKASASINTLEPWPVERLRLRNNALVVSKDLPLVAQIPFHVGRWWQTFRNSVPLRPSMWHLIPARVRQQRLRNEAIREGLSLGREQRYDAWARREIGRLEVMRWILRGTGPLR